MEWRYATKKFDTTKKINRTDLNKIKNAVQLSASSYGLQAYKILIIENPEVRLKLKEASWGQPQITDCSHLFVFCNYTNVNEVDVDDFIKLNAKTNGLEPENLSGLSTMIKGSLSMRSPEAINLWTSKQTYIALSTLLAAAAELKIDACPMEGFDSLKYNEILGLNERGLSAAVIASVGYRSPEDQYQFAKKVRKPIELLFEEI